MSDNPDPFDEVIKVVQEIDREIADRRQQVFTSSNVLLNQWRAKIEDITKNASPKLRPLGFAFLGVDSYQGGGMDNSLTINAVSTRTETALPSLVIKTDKDGAFETRVAGGGLPTFPRTIPKDADAQDFKVVLADYAKQLLLRDKARS